MILSSLPVSINGLSDAEHVEYRRLAQVWQDTSQRNALRMKYYLGHNGLKDLGIAIPPGLTKTETVVGWPAKAVDMLAARSMFDGFVADTEDGADGDPFGLREMLDENQFDALYDQAVRSQLIYCSAFWTVSKGNPENGEPNVMVSLRSAEYAAATWDFRRQRIRAGLAIVDISPDEPRQPTELNLYFDDYTVTARRTETNEWESTRVRNTLGRPAMEPMPFLPDYQRPFGRSRITREVMSITDSAQRGALREEVLMEFNTAPQKAILGAEEDAFDERRWKTYISSMLAINRDEEGEVPSLVQLPQLSPQGAILYMQHLAMRFAGATGVPVSSLGVVHENPSSAEAIRAHKDDLVTTAQYLNRGNRSVLVTVARMMLATRDDEKMAATVVGTKSLQGRFRNPGMPSVVSQSDAMVKQISAIPWLGETDVALEELGYDESQITRLMKQKRRFEGGNVLQRLVDANRENRERLQVRVEDEAGS